MGIFFKRATGVTCRVYIAFQLVEFQANPYSVQSTCVMTLMLLLSNISGKHKVQLALREHAIKFPQM